MSFYNGTLHIDTKLKKYEFAPHRSDDYITVQLPYFYDPNAQCPNWLKFLDEVTSQRKDAQAVLQEFIGYILYPDCTYQKALLLKGSGSNGKSIFTSIIKSLFGDFGEEDTWLMSAMLNLQNSGKDFRLMNLKDSWLNISSDTENNMVGGEGVIKKLIAGEVVEDSYKHKSPFPFKPRVKLIMCANTFPRTSDTSKGYLRRLIIIDFKQMFVEPDKIKEGFNQKPMDPHLLEKLLKELPGIFNWAVEGLMRLLENNAFTPLEDSDQLMLEFAQANNHIYCFVDEELGSFSKKTHRTNIFTAYRNWADAFGITPLPANRFYSNLKSVLEALGYKVEQQGRFWTILGVLPEPPEQEDPEKKTGASSL